MPNLQFRFHLSFPIFFCEHLFSKFCSFYAFFVSYTLQAKLHKRIKETFCWKSRHNFKLNFQFAHLQLFHMVFFIIPNEKPFFSFLCYPHAHAWTFLHKFIVRLTVDMQFSSCIKTRTSTYIHLAMNECEKDIFVL